MSITKGIVVAVLALVIALLIALAWYATPILRGGSGYAAKNLCSGHFLSRMSPETILEEALLTASPLLADIDYVVDTQKKQVDVTMFGMFARTAKYSPGIGCTLMPHGSDADPEPIVAQAYASKPADQPWPQGTAAPSIRADIQSLLDDAFTEQDLNEPKKTKAVVVIHKGQLIAEQYAPGIDATSPLIGWSMTKSVTNLLLGALVSDGKLSTAAPAPVPIWQATPSDLRASITLEHLMRMSSSLEFIEDYNLDSDVTHMLSNISDMGDFAADKPLISTAGSTWSYSSGTTNILTGIIRRTVGGDKQALYDFIQDSLFQPLGLSTATLEMDAAGTPIGSSYMYASARDWARLGQFCLDDGVWNGKRIMPMGWINYSTTPAPARPANDYGAQFWLNKDPSDTNQQRSMPSVAPDMFSMNGYQGQKVLMIPSAELVIVRLGFTPRGNHGVEALTATIIDRLHLSAEEVPAEPDSSPTI